MLRHVYFICSALSDVNCLMFFFPGRCTTFWIRCPSIPKFTNINQMISSPRMMRHFGGDKHQNSSTLLVSLFGCYTEI